MATKEKREREAAMERGRGHTLLCHPGLAGGGQGLLGFRSLRRLRGHLLQPAPLQRPAASQGFEHRVLESRVCRLSPPDWKSVAEAVPVVSGGLALQWWFEVGLGFPAGGWVKAPDPSH